MTEYTIHEFKNHVPFTVHYFQSFAEYKKAADDTSGRNKRNRQDFELEQSPKWFGIVGGHSGWDDYVRDGATSEQERIKELASKFQMKTPKGIRTKRRSSRGPQGDELDIHSVRSGNLDRAWRRTQKIEKKGKVKRITIIYQSHLYAGQNQDAAFYSPAAAAVLCQKLNEANVAIEIIATSWSQTVWKSNESGASSSLIIHRVKNMNAPLNIAALATTATAGYTRSLKFRLWCNSNLPAYGYMGTLDRSFDIWSSDLYEKILRRPDSEIISVPRMENEKSALDFITKTLREIEK